MLLFQRLLIKLIFSQVYYAIVKIQVYNSTRDNNINFMEVEIL